MSAIPFRPWHCVNFDLKNDTREEFRQWSFKLLIHSLFCRLNENYCLKTFTGLVQVYFISESTDRCSSKQQSLFKTLAAGNEFYSQDSHSLFLWQLNIKDYPRKVTFTRHCHQTAIWKLWSSLLFSGHCGAKYRCIVIKDILLMFSLNHLLLAVLFLLLLLLSFWHLLVLFSFVEKKKDSDLIDAAQRSVKRSSPISIILSNKI